MIEGRACLLCAGVDGNWRCPQCANINFGSREQCNRCRYPKPAEAGPGIPPGTFAKVTEQGVQPSMGGGGGMNRGGGGMGGGGGGPPPSNDLKNVALRKSAERPNALAARARPPVRSRGRKSLLILTIGI